MYSSAALTEPCHMTCMHSHELMYFYQSADSCVLLQNQQVSIYIKRINENTAAAPRALPCDAKTFS